MLNKKQLKMVVTFDRNIRKREEMEQPEKYFVSDHKVHGKKSVVYAQFSDTNPALIYCQKTGFVY